jgi:glycosyltransferase involved in cell wall biosynthesis
MYRAPVLCCGTPRASGRAVRLTISAVVPTVGRPALRRAVQSVLAQTRPVTEVIVVADTGDPVDLPHDSRIRLLRNSSRHGSAQCRQQGIDTARGSVVALIDDDDEWYPAKLERQLAAIAAGVPAGVPWVVSSRVAVLGPGDRQRTWPRRLIEPGQSVPDYLFRFRGLSVGGAVLQTSSLCFPTDLARRVRWDAHAGVAHDEPSWLIDVQRSVPEVRIVQLPDVLSTYNVAHQSVSRDRSDRSDAYIEWGLQYLRPEPARVLGDYLCTSPVSAAVSAQSLAGVRRSLRSALRHGRPGPRALAYAVLSAARIVGRSAVSTVRRRS